MAGKKVVLAGEKAASEALEESLRDRGVEARFHASDGLPESLVEIERELSDERPAGAVAVGTGEDALALAITASKLGVPLACVNGHESGADGDQSRILATLASLDGGSDPVRAADLIAAWLTEAPSAPDLD